MTVATSKALHRLYLEGQKTMAWVEANGIKIDTDAVAKQSALCTKKIHEGEDELRDDEMFRKWVRRFGTRTNLQSPAQLGEVLFKEMGIVAEFKTKTGRDAANEEALSKIDLPFLRKWFRVAKYRKIKGTYLAQIEKEVLDGLIHPSIDVLRAISGRSGMSEPNLQNIPSRNEAIMKIIRSCFVARHPDWRLIEIDYKNLEVRISCCLHRDPNLIRDVTHPDADMHRDLAAQIFMIPKADAAANKAARHVAKNKFVFAQFYGDVSFQIAPKIWRALDSVRIGGGDALDHLARKGIKELGPCGPGTRPTPGTFAHHLGQIERDFWGNRFRVFGEWRREEYRRYLERGYFTSPTGMVWRGVYRKNQVLNFGTQCSVFNCLLNALVRLHKWLVHTRKRSLVVNQIHDSMLLECPPEELDEVVGTAVRMMTEDVPLEWDWICVPLGAEVEVCPQGGCWRDKEPWDAEGGKWSGRKKAA